jgi:hypothetical protein
LEVDENPEQLQAQVEQLWVAEAYSKKGAYVFEIGAGEGVWSQQMADFSTKHLELFLFESDPRLYGILRDKLRKKSVHMYPLEVSLWDGVTIDCNGRKKSVCSLDKFCKKRGIETIDFLRIDRRASCFDVLLGALNLIEQGNIPFIQFCHLHENLHPVSFERIALLLQSNGYTIFGITCQKLVALRREEEAAQYDTYLAVYNDIGSLGI